MTYKIAKDKLQTLLCKIAGERKLYIPARSEDGMTRFTEYKEGIEYSPALKTLRSAKDFFFPQIENIAEYKVNDGKIEVKDIRKENEDFIIFGVRACDCASFDLLDKVFLSDPVDTFYENRRAHGTVITVACNTPGETCFCGTFGIDPAEPGGDVCCIFAGDEIILEPKTEKGETFISLCDGLLEKGGEEKADEEKKKIKDILEKLPLHDLKPDDFRERMQEVFDSEKWDSLSSACLGCGTCTFVCPTCQCYDIREFKSPDGRVERFRCWDSCMYSDFTLMAGGQPRTSQLQRFRQRFMHKLVYFPMNNEGSYLCVGCGRCLERCPINMNIVKVMKELKKGTAEEKK